MTNAISMNSLTKHYKDVAGPDRPDARRPGRHRLRLPRPERRRQDDRAQGPRRARPRDGRQRDRQRRGVSAAGEHRRQLGYLAQDPRFYGWMTGRETLRYVASFRGVGADRERQITELLGRVGIAEAADRRTSTYSGGMRQRLGIAQALVGRPAVILLDEPVSALDPIGRKDVLDLMRELKGETTVFYSTHILDDVQRVSDHVAILDHGRLVKAAPTHVLLGSFTANTLRVVLGGAKAATEVGMRQIPGVASVTVVSRSGDEIAYDVVTAGRRVRVGPAGDHAVRRQRRPDAHRQRGRDARPRDGLPSPHRPEGGGGMTAQPAELVSAPISTPRGGPFLGLRTIIGKEFSEWVRGPKALIILGVSVLGAVFMTLIPFIAEATGEAESAGLLSHDPTANVLLGWTGQTVALIAILATMALVSTERDRGTLGWTLTNPVSPTSVIAAKFIVAFGVFVATAVSAADAPVCGPGHRRLWRAARHARRRDVPCALHGAARVLHRPDRRPRRGVKSTVGVAGIAFAVLFLPQVLGGLLPIVNELSPTSIGSWALQVAKGQPASILTPIGWAISMIVLIVGAKVVFDRQEL